MEYPHFLIVEITEIHLPSGSIFQPAMLVAPGVGSLFSGEGTFSGTAAQLMNRGVALFLPVACLRCDRVFWEYFERPMVF